jgi:hypothetical protein
VKNGEKQPQFMPGLMLAEDFFKEAVEPILESYYPGLRYSAALIGSGSEVLGLDDEISSDHHWGPRVMLFLNPKDYEFKRDAIKNVLSEELPVVFRGYSTSFSEPNPEDNNVQIMQIAAPGHINHRVETHTKAGYFAGYLNIDITGDLRPVDWLTLPQHKLRSVMAGRVFRDDIGLEETRARFSWYPDDVWRYILASVWMRIGQEEHLMGRAGSVGDENGSAIIGARLVRDIMVLAFLMEKVYPPYAKWFGTAFLQLKSAHRLSLALTGALHSSSWEEREDALCKAYEVLADIHNSLGITERLSTKVSRFFDRPFKVIQGEKFAKAILERIKDPAIMPLTKHSLIGNIDTISDNTDLLADASLRTSIRALYE